MQPLTVRVFVSSTWLDLQAERSAVEAAIQRMRETKYLGMEYFGSRDETSYQTSLHEVDHSQVYVGIIAGRYGSGITEAEYRRAGQLGIPCLIYLKDDATIPEQWRDRESGSSAQLAAFKAELRNRHNVTLFKSPDELAAKFTADLHRWLLDAYPSPLLAKFILKGVQEFSADYSSRIQNFLTHYGTCQQE